MIMTNKRTVAGLLAATCLVTSLTACFSRATQPVQEEEPPADRLVFINTLKEPDYAQFARVGPKLTGLVGEKYQLNDDTVGWFYVPNTTINDVVVQNNAPDDKNQFYERRNFEKRSSWTGVYYSDYRGLFGESWEDLSRNTVIYGHSMDDDPDGAQFSQLKKYWDKDFAEDNPYIYFSTQYEDLTWEVFSVIFTTSDVNYNNPNFTDEEFSKMVGDFAQGSLYDYDVVVSNDDKILTISTCTYQFSSSYPNKDRFVIMARLVKDNEPIKDMAVLEKNPDAKGPR